MTQPPTDLQPLIKGAFLALADALERQPTSAWNAPSSCERWRVRDVAAHLSTAARYRPEEFLAELRADGGDLPRTIDRIAARDGELDTATLLANLRDDRLHRWMPPGGGEPGALTHVVIHGLDMTTPLGIGIPLPDVSLRTVLDLLTGSGVQTNFGVRLDDVELRADDLDWHRGQGRLVSGSAADLILALSGRHLGVGRISGVLRRS